MNAETFAAAHPIGYVHIAYSVVIVLHAGWFIYLAAAWRRAQQQLARTTIGSDHSSSAKLTPRA